MDNAPKGARPVRFSFPFRVFSHLSPDLFVLFFFYLSSSLYLVVFSPPPPPFSFRPAGLIHLVVFCFSCPVPPPYFRFPSFWASAPLSFFRCSCRFCVFGPSVFSCLAILPFPIPRLVTLLIFLFFPPLYTRRALSLLFPSLLFAYPRIFSLAIFTMFFLDTRDLSGCLALAALAKVVSLVL